MSLSPADYPQSTPGTQAAAANPPGLPGAAATRASRLWTMCFILLALEVGGFLAVFPWIDAWHLNHLPAFFPAAFGLWDDSYFRGAVTGLGLANLLVALAQSFYLVRSLRKNRG